jgi:hypothetical protein
MTEELFEFVNTLTEWHSAKVANLRSIAEGEGSFTLKIADSEAEQNLTDRDAAFFRAGMETVLMELGELPFSVSTSIADDEEDES